MKQKNPLDAENLVKTLDSARGLYAMVSGAPVKPETAEALSDVVRAGHLHLADLIESGYFSRYRKCEIERARQIAAEEETLP